jgi:uncharacterized protein YndB with AHSA1/START domain
MMPDSASTLASGDSSATFEGADALHCDLVVPLSRDRAFALFRHDIYHWWPRNLTWCDEALEHLFLEGRKGGMFWERGPDGLRLDCARVMRWLPPERIVLRWHIGPARVPEPNAAKASEVDIQFTAGGEGNTRIDLIHRGFANHGDGGWEYRASMGSVHGWPHVLKCFAEHCEISENLRKFHSGTGHAESA